MVESYGPESEAERALEKAKADAPARLAAEFRGVALEPGPTVEQAEAAVAAIRRKRDDIRVARDALEAETKLAANRASLAARHREGSRGAGGEGQPGRRRPVHGLRGGRASLHGAAAGCRYAGREGVFPDRAVGHRPGKPDRGISHQWTSALQALSSDPAAPLPEAP